MSPLPLQDLLYPHALGQKFPPSPRARRQIPTDGSSIPLSTASSFAPTGSQTTTSISSTTISNPSQTSTSTPKIASPGPYLTPTSTPIVPGVNTDTDSRPNIKAIVFGVLGGILGFVVLLLIILHGLRRRRSSRGKAAFWEKWHWGAYSPVHGDVVFINQDTSVSVSGERGSKAQVPAQWWQKFNFIGDAWAGDEAMIEGGEQGKKKKQRTRTLYKVRSLKPNEKFEIDSGADMSVVDLASGPR